MRNNIKTAYNILQQRIHSACSDNARKPSSVQLLAVSKKQTAQAIRSGHQLGIDQFGENYLQEALEKQQQLTDLDINWHFIGAVQSNKARAIAEHFDWLHTVDRLKIAKALDRFRSQATSPLNCCIQINTSGQASKAGTHNMSEILELASYIDASQHLSLRGLMTIPSPSTESARQEFTRLNELLQQLKQDFPNSPLDTLSMGMSNDLEIAIAEGATMIRVGSALFGQRL